MTIAEMIRRFAAERPEQVALKWEGGRLTYAELDRRASRVGQALRASGVGAGDRVALLDKNGPEQIELIFGAAKLGAVPTPVNWRLARPEVEAILADSLATVFVVGGEYAEMAGEVVEAIERPIELIVLGGGDPGRDYEAWLEAQPEEDPGHEPAGDDVAIQFYSSGTTGQPKGVELTHAGLDAVLALWEDAADFGGDSVILCALPLFHVGGAGFALAGHYYGATNVLMRDALPDKVVAILAEEAITHAGLVPALMQFMLQVPGIDDNDYSALQTIVYGAAPISETILTKMVRTFHCEFQQAYGLTETSSTVAILPPGDHDPDGENTHRLRACGLPVRGTEFRVVDPATGDDVGTDEVGEFLIKGPSVMKGYWNRPDLTEEAIVDGWLRSGDAGYRDADGYLFLHDRVKDMIVSGAENIYPAEVENALMSHPAVADVAVIAVPSERWGETPKAIVVRDEGAGVTEDDLIAHCRENLATYKCPSSVDWIDELPRTATGKVLKKELRAPYWEGQTRGVG